MLSPLAQRYDHVLLDLDGCVWVGDEPTPRAVEAVGELRAAGKHVAFVTNDARLAGEDFVRKLWRLGFQASLEEVVTVGGALQHLLAESSWRSAYVVGSAAVHRHVEDAGLRILNRSDLAAGADVVVVAAHDDFNYTELRGAVRAVLRGAALIGAGRDATFPMPDGPAPGTGAVLAAVEAASGATAQTVGKPDAQIFRTALDRLGEGRALVVGDRLDADVAGAHAAGLDAALVLTGATLPAEAAAAQAAEGGPVAVADTLAALVLTGGGVTARHASLIVNPSAGGGRAAAMLPAVEAALRGHGVVFHTERTEGLEHCRVLARAAAESGEVAVTLSGDGLVGCVAGVLRDIPGSVMGVLPGGRGNDFARVAGIPRDPVAACAVVADGVETPIDVGDVGGRTFIGIASVGFDSVANRIANEAPHQLGRLVYVYGALRALATWHHAGFDVEVDGRRRAFRGWSVAAANSKAYGGGMFLAPDADLQDGELDVVIATASSRRQYIGGLRKVFDGAHVDEPNVEILRGAEVRISADRPFTVYADGDPIGELPVTIRAVPGAVRVLLPAPPA